MLETLQAAPAANAQAIDPATGTVVPNGGTHGEKPALPREIGGREGPEPTRFGDWEKGGRCIDF